MNYCDVQINCKLQDKFLTKKIKFWINLLFFLLKINYEITIRIVEEEEIKKLNFLYREKNRVTNILSFFLDFPKYIYPSYLGDIVLCYKVIQEEALKQKKSFDERCLHIIIHGCLHLLGFSHQDKLNRKKMEKIEIEILNLFGYSNPFIEKVQLIKF